MGVPGTTNSYTKCWKLGLYTILIYPFAWFCLFRFWKKGKGHGTVEQVSTLNLSAGAGALLLLAVASAAVFYAFKIMS